MLHRQLRIALENDIAVYSSHLPLDIHPLVGNNVRLASVLGLRATEPFLKEKGQLVGLKARSTHRREDIARKLTKSLGHRLKMFPFGPDKTRVIGIVTGAAGSEIHRVAEEKVDTFITGEAPHWAAVAAEELGINLVLGGHYATETFGVKAFAAHLGRRFRLPFEFIDRPTGL